ncbi:MAG: NUDIX hydrolase, partial [Actinomycetota bacterium]|nr:NUDIX hydrolase [Actinomycetota bacterium]
FVADGRRVHKTVHHYLLVADDPVHGLELSDADVEVSEVAWVPLAELAGRLAYADERRLLERVPALLAETA